MPRCKAVIETIGGDFIRCSQVVMDNRDDCCYYHGKIMDGTASPSTMYSDDNPERPVAYYVMNSDGKGMTLVRVVDEYGYKVNREKESDLVLTA